MNVIKKIKKTEPGFDATLKKDTKVQSKHPAIIHLT